VRFPTRTGWVLILLLLTAIGVALVPLSTGVPAGTTESAEFRAYMYPRLNALLAASEEVNGMVSERSRNVLALRAESERITTLTADIDAWLASADIPAWAEPVVDDYTSGRDLILEAIDEAYAALRSFDFSAMPGMIPRFEQGTELIARALDVLENPS
jgi:hypothetical protein